MKLILLQDVKKVGKKDEVVEVSDGYAKNFLLKQNLAIEVTKSSNKQLKIQKENEKIQHDIDVANAEKLKIELESKEFEFHLKAGKGGSVFGSVSSKQILKKLQDEGYKVNKKMILSEPISHLGYDRVKLQLHKEVVAEIKILIKGD